MSMFTFREGTYFIRSESDPRWNITGRDFMSGISGPCNFNIENYIKEKEAEIGPKPDDLTIGWMKD